MDLTAFILNIQQRTKENHHFVMKWWFLAPPVGLEPTTCGLTERVVLFYPVLFHLLFTVFVAFLCINHNISLYLM